MKKDIIEEKSSEFETLRQELESIDAQNQEINIRMAEFKSALEIISQVKKAKPNQEIIMPLSEGLMLKVYIKDPNKALIGIGNKIIVEKNSEECDKYIKERIDEADSLMTQLDNEANNITLKLRKLEHELIELTKEEKK
ncbi:MAG: prefoldin subunit alpha [Candidatus Nanoarchaeia archaeon]|nr:prefoldin subunit alpha [Candidatus Nanoarchaeia archaeon]